MIKKKIVVSVSNDLNTDQRVAKMCDSLVKLGHEVVLLGRRKRDSHNLQPKEYTRRRLNLLFEKGPLFYAEFNLSLFFNLLYQNADVYYANDLDTLLANFLVSKIKRKKLIYDSHEIFTEVPELQNRFAQKVWVFIEKWIFPKLKKVITVNDSISEFYHNKYQIKPEVIRNFPLKKNETIIPFTKQDIGIKEETALLILQGAGINIDRGAEEAVEMMKFLPNALLLIIGNGDVISLLKDKVAEENLDAKVRFIPRHPYDEMIRYTAAADIGLSLDKNTNLNYYYSLPNKIMDYVSAGTPVLVSDLPELKRLVEEYSIGVVAENHNPEYLAVRVQEMIASDFKNVYRKKLQNAAEILCWENEVKGKFEDFL